MPPLVPSEYSAQPHFCPYFTQSELEPQTLACLLFLTSLHLSFCHCSFPGTHPLRHTQVVSKLVQIREYISKASSMRDDLVEKNDVPANVERLSHLIDHLKQQEKSYLRFLQKMLVSVFLLKAFTCTI